MIDRGKKMQLRITKVLLTAAAVIIFAVSGPPAFCQQDTKGKPTTKGQMKEAGRETARAGKSLGHHFRRGHIRRGGRRFGKHIGHAGRHLGRGTKHAVKTAAKP